MSNPRNINVIVTVDGKNDTTVRLSHEVIPATGDLINQQGSWYKVTQVTWNIDNSHINIDVELSTKVD